MTETPKRRPRIDLRDALFVVGAGMLFYGVWCVFPPAAFIVIGAILLAVAFIAARR